MKRLKFIPGFEGRYSATTDGRIYSHLTNRYLRPSKAGQYKYDKVVLRRDGKSLNRYVHRLVWETFRGRIPIGKQINHKNGIRSQNRLKNLECVTPKRNSQHAWKLGLSTPEQKGKLKEAQVVKIRQLRQKGVTLKALGDMFGVSDSAISMACKRKTWSRVA